MKLKDITNSRCDIRKYMSVDMDSESKDFYVKEYGISYSTLDEIIENCSIYVDMRYAETDITSGNLVKLPPEDINERIKRDRLNGF